MNSKDRKILRRSLMGLGVAAALSSIIYTSLYAAIKNSNAYLCVSNYIDQSNAINEEFGEIKKLSLSPNKFYFKSDGADGSAKMKIHIVGKNKNGNILFSLKQESGRWVVQEAHVL